MSRSKNQINPDLEKALRDATDGFCGFPRLVRATEAVLPFLLRCDARVEEALHHCSVKTQRGQFAPLLLYRSLKELSSPLADDPKLADTADGDWFLSELRHGNLGPPRRLNPPSSFRLLYCALVDHCSTVSKCDGGDSAPDHLVEAFHWIRACLRTSRFNVIAHTDHWLAYAAVYAEHPGTVIEFDWLRRRAHRFMDHFGADVPPDIVLLHAIEKLDLQVDGAVSADPVYEAVHTLRRSKTDDELRNILNHFEWSQLAPVMRIMYPDGFRRCFEHMRDTVRAGCAAFVPKTAGTDFDKMNTRIQTSCQDVGFVDSAGTPLLVSSVQTINVPGHMNGPGRVESERWKRLGKHSDLRSIRFVGGSAIGKTSVVLRFSNGSVLLDFGLARPGVTDWTWFEEFDSVEAVLISHCHLDHIGGLLQMYGTWAKEIPWFALPENKEIARLVLTDACKVSRMQAGRMIYDPDMVDLILDRHIPVNVREPVEILPGVRATAFHAGHVYGSCSWLVESENASVFFTGDYSPRPSFSVPGLDWPEPEERANVDILVSEGTYADSELAVTAREISRTELLDRITTKLIDHPCVLVPVMSLGRAQEVIACLNDTPWKVAVLGMASKLTILTGLGINPNIELIRDFQPRRLMDYIDGFDVVVATAGSLQGGPSRAIFDEIFRADPTAPVILTGYQFAGTPGRGLASKAADYVRFSAHATASDFGDMLKTFPNAERYVIHFPGDQMRLEKNWGVTVPIGQPGFPFTARREGLKLEVNGPDTQAVTLSGQEKPKLSKDTKPTNRIGQANISRMNAMHKRAYITFNEELAKYLPSAFCKSADWRQAVFDDLTENGRQLYVEFLPSGDGRPRIGLSGDHCYCEAGPDNRRSDSLFVFRIEPAKNCPSVPRKIVGDFRLLEGRMSEQLEPVADLFDHEPEKDEPTKAPAAPAYGAEIVGPMKDVIRQNAGLLRKDWRPDREIAEPEQVGEFLRTVRTPWLRYSLEKVSNVSDRRAMVLNGQITPPEMDTDARDAILSLLDGNLMSRFGIEHEKDTDKSLALLRAIAGLKVPVAVRMSVWGEVLAGLDQADVWQELNITAPQLLELANESKSTPNWKKIEARFLTSLEASVSGDDESRLGQVLDQCRESENPVAELANWAMRLRFKNDFPGNVAELEPATDAETDVAEEETDKSGPSYTGTAGLPSSEFSDWVLRMRIPDLAHLNLIREEMRTSFLQAAHYASEGAELNAIHQLALEVHSIADRIDGWVNDLPDPEALIDDTSKAAEAIAAAGEYMGEALIGLTECFARPSDLIEALELMQEHESFPYLPTWTWFEAQESQLDSVEIPKGIGLLGNPIIRRRVRVMLSLIREHPDVNRNAFSRLPAPPHEIDESEAAFASHYRQLIEDFTALFEEVPEIAGWARDSLESGGIDIADLRTIVHRFKTLRESVSEEVFEHFFSEILPGVEPRNLEQYIRRMEAAVKWFRDNLHSAREVTVSQLKGWLITHRDAIVVSAEDKPEFHIEHNWVDTSNARANLVFSSYSGDPYGSVSAPMVIESRRKQSVDIRFTYQFHSKTLRSAWPGEWRDPSPQELHINVDNWRDHPSKSDCFVCTFNLDMPIREPKDNKEPLEVTISAINTETDEPICEPRKFRWTNIDVPREPIMFDWPQIPDPDFVTQHPVGPQEKHKDIERLVTQRGSFAVTAPRRFGKTILVQHLQRLGSRAELLVPKYVDCVDYSSSSRSFDYGGVWAEFSDGIKALGCDVDLRELDSHGIPSAAAFNRLRNEAGRLGIEAVVFLFDEAQLFFPRGERGYDLGDRIKGLIEHQVAVGNSTTPAGIVFGFIGLPSLRDRMGANLAAKLEPFRTNEINEATLNRIIQRVTAGTAMQTTLEARRRLALVSRNMWILKQLLEKLTDRLREQRRTWVGFDDVNQVENQLKVALHEGTELTLIQLIRDIMNDADSINNWKPNPSYPVAIALALAAERTGYDDADACLDSITAILNQWCRAIFESSVTMRSYDRPQVEAHLETLRERGVLDGIRFRSDLVKAWLVGCVTSGMPRDPEVKHALRLGSISRVMRPGAGMEPIWQDTGGKSRVFRFKEGDLELAWHETGLQSAEQQAQFQERSAILAQLSREFLRRPNGSQYICQLNEVGLLHTNELIGVQVYVWVEGAGLETKIGQLNDELVAEVGFKLAQGLEFAHGIDIAHGNINPANIVVSGGFNPVLINFATHFVAPGAYSDPSEPDLRAPETRSPSSPWSKSADIYSLGATLELLQMQSRIKSTNLTAILDRCIDGNPDRRPTAKQLVEDLTSLRSSFDSEMQKRLVRSRIEAAVSGDQDAVWLQQVLLSLRNDIEAALLGYGDFLHRCKLIANLLNQLIENYAKEKHMGQLTLGRLPHKTERFGSDAGSRAIQFLAKARDTYVHGGESDEKLLTRFNNPSDEQITEWCIEGAKLLEEITKANSITGIVRLIIGDTPLAKG